MRKVFVLLLCIVSLASLGQPIVSRAGSANTVSDARLQAAINFYLPRYADTSFAASSLGVDSTGALIYTYVPNAIWVRKANPKKWVRITDANTNPYSAGFGLTLISNVFSVDSTVIATRGRLYKVVDSLISVRAPGLPSVLNVDNDADGKSIYNLSSLFALDTLKTNGPFQLGYGVYTTSFPRTLTANRTMVVPDQSDTLAGRTWTRNLVSSISPTAPGLGPVLSVSGDGGGADITNVGTLVANFTIASAGNVDASAGDGANHGFSISDFYMNLITPSGGGADDRQLRFLDDHYGGGVQKRVWLQVNKAANGDTYIPFSVNGQFADDNGNITVSTGGVDTTTISTRDYAKKVGDSTYGRVAASFLTSATAATTYVPKTTTVTAGTLLSGGGALSGNITVGLDTTGAATRDYAKKVGDSTYGLVAASFLTSATAATTYFPLAGGSITGTAGAGYIGLIPQSSAPSTPASGVRLYTSPTGAFTWKGTNGFQRTFSGTGITADRTYTLPDAAGTLALTSDLTPYLTAATAAATYQTIAARVTKAVYNAWTNNATVSASTTQFYGASVVNTTFSSTETARQSITAVGGVARNFYIRVAGTQPSPGDVVVTVRINTVSTGITITIPAGTTTGTFSDLTHTATLAAGDLISYQAANAATTASIGFSSFSLEITNN